MTDDTAALTGHVKIARKAFGPDRGDPFWLEDRTFSRWEAWVDVIQLAAWRSHRSATAKFGVIELHRGEFVASLRWLADRWGWTVKRVRVWLATCEKGSRIRAQRETQAGTVYLLVNYDTYQGRGHSKGHRKGHTKGHSRGTAGAQQGHKTEAVEAVEAVSVRASVDARAAAAKRDTASRGGWVGRIGDFWQGEVGHVTYGHLGRALKPYVERHGEETVERAARLYVAAQRPTGRAMKFAWFVENIALWIERASAHLVVDGEMSPELELMTRPDAARAKVPRPA